MRVVGFREKTIKDWYCTLAIDKVSQYEISCRAPDPPVTCPRNHEQSFSSILIGSMLSFVLHHARMGVFLEI